MGVPEQPGRWRYQPDEIPKKKHHWDRNEADFVEVDGVPVGKCPANITIPQAEVLLNSGIPWVRPGTPDLGYPDAIYVVHEGVVYRAKPTNIQERSYHAFPELPARLRELPRALRGRILESAAEQGCEDAVRRWMNS